MNAPYTAPLQAAVTLADDRLRACAAATGRPVDPAPPVVEPVAPAAGGSGSGALSTGWLLGLAAAVLVLAGARRPQRAIDAR